jgi:hypothetical protein
MGRKCGDGLYNSLLNEPTLPNISKSPSTSTSSAVKVESGSSVCKQVSIIYNRPYSRLCFYTHPPCHTWLSRSSRSSVIIVGPVPYHITSPISDHLDPTLFAQNEKIPDPLLLPPPNGWVTTAETNSPTLYAVSDPSSPPTVICTRQGK